MDKLIVIVYKESHTHTDVLTPSPTINKPTHCESVSTAVL